jgi:hypothetical protein
MKTRTEVKEQILSQTNEIRFLLQTIGESLPFPMDIDRAARQIISAATVIKDLAYELDRTNNTDRAVRS